MAKTTDLLIVDGRMEKVCHTCMKKSLAAGKVVRVGENIWMMHEGVTIADLSRVVGMCDGT